MAEAPNKLRYPILGYAYPLRPVVSAIGFYTKKKLRPKGKPIEKEKERCKDVDKSLIFNRERNQRECFNYLNFDKEREI